MASDPLRDPPAIDHDAASDVERGETATETIRRLEARIAELERGEREHQQARERLRASREMLRLVMDHIPQGIYWKDLSSTYLGCNRHFAQMAGVGSIDEVIGKTDDDLPWRRWAHRYREADRSVIRTDGPFVNHEGPYVKPDGSEGWLRTSKVPLHDAAGRVVAILGVDEDFTERRETEAMLQRSRDELERRVAERTADLAAAHRDLKALLYIVSHDLRAPLINVKGFTGELERGCEVIHGLLDGALEAMPAAERAELDRLLDHEMPEALAFIGSSVTRINHFMNTLLRLSHQDQRSLSLERVEAREVVEETLASLAFQLDQHRAEVEIGELPAVLADRLSIEQIFGNLLSNAVLYLDPSRPGRIEVSGEESGGFVVYRVADNGRGIAEEDMAKVFAPFRRGPHRQIEGEGMGLAYVQALVRRHGGRIWCESELGVGTTFGFSISSALREEDLRGGAESLLS